MAGFGTRDAPDRVRASFDGDRDASAGESGKVDEIRATIAGGLDGPARALPIHVVAGTVSTNLDLLDPVRFPEQPACVLLALAQSGGRGRSGRRWLSDGGTLTFSLRWQFVRASAGLLGLPLAVAVALVQGLEDLAVTGLAIKWPNDLLRHGRKLGGILVEVSGGRSVIGVGLNLQLDPELAAALDQPAADLQPDLGARLAHAAERRSALATAPGARASATDTDLPGSSAPKREAVLAALLNRLVPALSQFDAHGFPAFRADWTRRAAWLGEMVTLGDATSGRLIGVDADGAALIETAKGVERCLVGDLSLRARA